MKETCTHMDWIQYFDGGFAAIDLVKHFINFPISPFANCLNDLPGVRRIGKAVKDDGFPGARKHLPKGSPGDKKDTYSVLKWKLFAIPLDFYS